jgi:hypothetical protein
MTRLLPDSKETRELAKKIAEKAKKLDHVKSVKPIKKKSK